MSKSQSRSADYGARVMAVHEGEELTRRRAEHQWEADRKRANAEFVFGYTALSARAHTEALADAEAYADRERDADAAGVPRAFPC